MTVSRLAIPALVSTRHEYDHLFSVYVPIAVGVFAIVVLAICFAVLRYRRRPARRPPAGTRTTRSRAATRCCSRVVVAFLLYLTFTAEHKVDTVANRERPSLTHRRHRRQVGVGVSLSRRTASASAAGPSAGSRWWSPPTQAIRFNLTSADVIHAFWIPELELQARPDPRGAPSTSR